MKKFESRRNVSEPSELIPAILNAQTIICFDYLMPRMFSETLRDFEGI